ncbi:MAG: hypothetical protein IJX88_03255 [Clostridia bacterium]|nr:hypothetical protein [Clostridia bacterium]
MVKSKNVRKQPSQKYTYLKERIAKVQGKAKFIGFLYLIVLLAVSALALVFPMLTPDKEDVSITLTVMSFWKVFVSAKGAYKANAEALLLACVYGVMVLALVINVLRALSKLNWLFKKRASRIYGFNRNMYAMDDLGRIFSSSFAFIIICHFVIALLVSDYKAIEIEKMAYITLAVGFFFHFVCGIAASKVGLFETENGVQEIARQTGVVASVFRNVLQIIIVAALGYFFLACSELRATLDAAVENGVKTTLKDWKGLLFPAAQGLLLIWFFALTFYATGTTEYDLEGADAHGRKLFLLFAFLALVTAGGAVAYVKFIAKAETSVNMIIIAAIALAATVLELCLIRLPKAKVEGNEEVDSNKYLAQNIEIDYNKPGVYLTPPPAAYGMQGNANVYGYDNTRSGKENV